MHDEKNKRLAGLDVLRGLCALIVVFFHYTVDYSQKFGWVDGGRLAFQIPLGSMGVRIFFVISGFAILMSLERSVSFAEFAKNRASRLYPAYLFAILLTSIFIFCLDYNPRQVGLIDIPYNLFFTAPLLGKVYIDAPYWTLTHEVFFYALIGSLFYLLKAQKVILTIFVWLIFSTVWNLFGADEHYFDNFTKRSMVSVLFNTQYAYLFSLGMLLYLIYKGERGFLLFVTFVFSLVAAGFAEWPTNGHVFLISQSLKALGYSVIVFFFARIKSGIFSPNALVYVGQCSYSIYLVHETIGYFIIAKSQSELNFSPILSIFFAAAVVMLIAHFMRSFIEVPGQLFMKRFWSKARFGA